MGRVRRQQGRPRPVDRRARRREPRTADLRGRPGRHGHGHAPGRVPRRGHQRPPGARVRRPLAAGADRGRPVQRSLPGRRTADRSHPMTARFALPAGAEAGEPPESRGLQRDEVRLMAVTRGGIRSLRFRDLPELLEPGDLVVVNTSATLPGRLPARRADGVTVPLHWSTTLDDGDWVVELRRRDNRGPDLGVEPGTRLALPGGVSLTMVAGYPDPLRPTRLWRARTTPAVPTTAYLAEHGAPIGYGYLHGEFALAAFQTVYATEPGSAEMVSAGRPFTEELLVALMARGVPVVPLTLHAGVSSPELHEPPSPERFAVPEVTARLVTSTRQAGRRVGAGGTTGTRALETATGDDGITPATAGWTALVLGPDRPARAVTGLITGLHEPQASHLHLLEAVAGPDLVAAAYDRAVAEHYLWHEFGDSMVFLP